MPEQRPQFPLGHTHIPYLDGLVHAARRNNAVVVLAPVCTVAQFVESKEPNFSLQFRSDLEVWGRVHGNLHVHQLDLLMATPVAVAAME